LDAALVELDGIGFELKPLQLVGLSSAHRS
jgi:hypothetical protein